MMSRQIAIMVLLLFMIQSANAAESRKSLLDHAIARSSDSSLANDRIVGGSKAAIGANPWQVALVWSGSDNNVKAQFCGGSIISQDWVLTAAHCIDKSKPPDAYHILSGTDSLESGGVRSKVLRYFPHALYAYREGDHENDIALLRIDPKGPRLAGQAIPIIEAINEQIAKGTLVLVTGWGVTEQRYMPTIDLQFVPIPYVENDTCNIKKSYNGRVSSNMLCAGEETGGKDPCWGDSGGPASIKIQNTWKLIGIVSWSEGCGDPDKYGVFTRVSEYRKWIQKIQVSEMR